MVMKNGCENISIADLARILEGENETQSSTLTLSFLVQDAEILILPSEAEVWEYQAETDILWTNQVRTMSHLQA